MDRTPLPPTAFTTYELVAPRATHRRRATCTEVACEQHTRGWATSVLQGSEDEALLLAACRGEVDGLRRSGLRLAEPGGFVRYVFEAGQPCFAAGAHSVRNDAEAIGIRRDRNKLGVGSPELYRHHDLDDWVEDFGEHQQVLSDAAKEG